MVHHIGREHGHPCWSRHIPSVRTVSSGETVTFDTIDSSSGQITPTSDATTLREFDTSQANPVFGPVWVRDAQPGDVLRVEVVALETADWGWTAIIPGFGLLADEFPDPVLRIWRLDPGERRVRFGDSGVSVPLRPFLGCMGVAPATDETLSTVPPTHAGGNLDCRELTVGAAVSLPVQTAGALFSCGDGHAAQGHGEVCGTAIETPMRATLRFVLHKDQPWVTTPHYETPPRGLELQSDETLGRYAVMGIEDNLLGATREAVRGLIRWLVETKGLTRTDAYMLTSVAGDLQVVQAVNMPQYSVSMSLALGLFAEMGMNLS
ncbi:acetamidase/formamidase family protein [Aspergillus campestris IBT 28561]|uniref:Acetamidase/formamidase family protein n=1 Tax=Aspergillus campestris (strain IBT 28561) TaxID=1392248 RepID=A0A2I1D3U2_ASPC2|nr:acetamidase/formamidase family protein [Aspergillus campestris IBT 28561]PKY04547.1 acetamidase/formamidase family protein [Aspergillus campestris IBT 28561]